MEAFCSTLKSEKQRILDQFYGASDLDSGDELADSLAGLGASVQAIGELQTYFNKLSEVAPEEIRTETEIVAQEYEEQLDAVGGMASDPLAGAAAALLSGGLSSGQLNAVNEFALEHCGESI